MEALLTTFKTESFFEEHGISLVFCCSQDKRDGVALTDLFIKEGHVHQRFMCCAGCIAVTNICVWRERIFHSKQIRAIRVKPP